MGRLLEICVDSLASARNAIAGGADRLELCGALAVGGLTPYTELLRQIRGESDIAVRCLMRPRPGDFLYTAEEIRLMAQQMQALAAAGADGFVIGCLTAAGEPDGQAMKPLLAAAGDKQLTLHRCIDVSRDPVQTYLEARALGFDTVLTSGCARRCSEGMEVIGRLLALQAEGGPQVLIGAGVNAGVITAFRGAFSNADAFHMSGSRSMPSGMVFRREGVPMGAPGFDEWSMSQTEKEAVQAARAALDR